MLAINSNSGRSKSFQPAIENQLVAVFVVLFVVNQIADVFQACRDVEQNFVRNIHGEVRASCLEDGAGQGRNARSAYCISTPEDSGQASSLDSLRSPQSRKNFADRSAGRFLNHEKVHRSDAAIVRLH